VRAASSSQHFTVAASIVFTATLITRASTIEQVEIDFAFVTTSVAYLA
jgi:hypothetical protein